MPLDPKARNLLTAIATAGDPPVQLLPAGKARTLVESRYGQLKLPLKKVNSVTNRAITGPARELTLRIYTPEGNGPFPILLFFHGGGWVLFRPEHYDSVCTHLCAGAGCLVVSVDYRLSPETKFPGALDDCTEALLWISGNASTISGDPSRIILCGDSAGGNLVAATALRNRDENGPLLLGQVLLYPVMAWYDPPTRSFLEFADGYSVTREAMIWFWDQYLEAKEQSSDPYAVPLIAANTGGLPDALIIVAGFDPLRDEGIMYAEKLKQTGVDTVLVNYESMIHGFLSYLGILDQGQTAIKQICEWLDLKFRRPVN